MRNDGAWPETRLTANFVVSIAASSPQRSRRQHDAVSLLAPLLPPPYRDGGQVYTSDQGLTQIIEDTTILSKANAARAARDFVRTFERDGVFPYRCVSPPCRICVCARVLPSERLISLTQESRRREFQLTLQRGPASELQQQ